MTNEDSLEFGPQYITSQYSETGQSYWTEYTVTDTEGRFDYLVKKATYVKLGPLEIGEYEIYNKLNDRQRMTIFIQDPEHSLKASNVGLWEEYGHHYLRADVGPWPKTNEPITIDFIDVNTDKIIHTEKIFYKLDRGIEIHLLEIENIIPRAEYTIKLQYLTAVETDGLIFNVAPIDRKEVIEGEAEKRFKQIHDDFPTISFGRYITATLASYEKFYQEFSPGLKQFLGDKFSEFEPFIDPKIVLNDRPDYNSGIIPAKKQLANTLTENYVKYLEDSQDIHEQEIIKLDDFNEDEKAEIIFILREKMKQRMDNLNSVYIAGRFSQYQEINLGNFHGEKLADRIFQPQEDQHKMDLQLKVYDEKQAIKESEKQAAIEDIKKEFYDDLMDKPKPEDPPWVENIFNWYGEQRISQDELHVAIQYLIDRGILQSR